MESVNVVGGIKTEPLEIHYLLPPDGTSVDINVMDLYSDSDEYEEAINVGQRDWGSNQSDSNMECVKISDTYEDATKTGRQIFNYVGRSKEDKTKKSNLTEEERCVFNYTKNEDLLFYNDSLRFAVRAEMTQENVETNSTIIALDQLQEEPLNELNSDNDVDNEINSDSELNNDSTVTVQNNEERGKEKINENPSTATVSKDGIRCQTRINLAEAALKDDISYKEYKEKKGRYVCLYCYHKDTLQNIKNHIIEEHKKSENKQCPFCNVKTKVLTYHIRIEHKEDTKMHKCPECTYIAKALHILNGHIEYKHRVEVAKCDKCGKIFRTKRHLYKHYRRQHKDQRTYQCVHCDCTLRSNQALKIHLKRHEDPKEESTLLCDKCDFRTKNQLSFARHQLYHKQTMHVQVCDQCGYTARTPGHLKLHLVGHKKEPDADDFPHHCDQCDYKTHRTYSLQVHKLKHLKPEEIAYFYCYHCNFKAKRKDNLKTHIFKLHVQQEKTALKCSVCPFTTSKKHLLVKHVDKHSKNVYPL